MAAASSAYARGAGAEPDRMRLARIEEERELALGRLRELDVAERDARRDRERPALSPDEVRGYL